MVDDALTQAIIECAIEVHRELGPGLLESTYQLCLSYEFHQRKLAHVSGPALPVTYKELIVPNAYRPDLIIENEVIVELKHVEKVLSVHEAQLRTYLKLSGFRTGLLLNFNSTVLKNGIRRLTLPKTSPVSRTPSSPSHT